MQPVENWATTVHYKCKHEAWVGQTIGDGDDGIAMQMTMVMTTTTITKMAMTMAICVVFCFWTNGMRAAGIGMSVP